MSSTSTTRYCPQPSRTRALTSGGYPYDEEMKKKVFKEELLPLQLELLKLQTHLQETGERFVALFEGRDASGKGSCISRFLAAPQPAPRALRRAVEADRGRAWPVVFPALCRHLPTAGDIVLFDRSWYNRAGVERVMGFCTPAQTETFLRDAPDFEALLVRDGIRLFKFYLVIGREMQLMRFHERRHDPFKRWKITDIDVAAIDKWDDLHARAGRNLRAHEHAAVTVDHRARQRSAACAAGDYPLGVVEIRLPRQGRAGRRHARSEDHRHRP